MNKRGNVFFPILFVVIFITIIFLLIFTMVNKSNSIDYRAGFKGLNIIKAFEEAQAYRLFLDLSAHKTLQQAYYDSLAEDDCIDLTKDISPEWNIEYETEEGCFPDIANLKENIKEKFASNIGEELSRYSNTQTSSNYAPNYKYDLTFSDGKLYAHGTAEDHTIRFQIKESGIDKRLFIQKDYDEQTRTAPLLNPSSQNTATYSSQVLGQSSAMCSYCGHNKQLVKRINTAEFTANGCSGGSVCCRASCPSNSFILNGPSYSQNQYGGQILRAGCGLVSTEMAMEMVSGNNIDINHINNNMKWDYRGTSLGNMETYVQRYYPGNYNTNIVSRYDVNLDHFLHFLQANSGIIMNIDMAHYKHESSINRGGGHFYVVVGVAEINGRRYFIVRDPYTEGGSGNWQYGNNLVISSESFQKQYRNSRGALLVITKK